MLTLAGVPEVAALSHGRAVGWQPGYDYAMSVDVVDRAAFDAYKASPEHVVLIGVLSGIVADIARIQIEVDAQSV